MSIKIKKCLISKLKRFGEILKIKGIGQKIGILYMRIAENKNEGISVDTHCHRIPNRLKWYKTNSPKKRQEKLENIFDKKEWEFVNETLVGFGQNICDAKKPNCKICPLRNFCEADENYCKKSLKK